MTSVLMFMFSPLDSVPPVLNEGKSLAKQGFHVDLIGVRYWRHQPRQEKIAERFTLRRFSLVSRLLLGEHDAFSPIRYVEFALRCFLWGVIHPGNIVVGHDLITLPFAYPLAKLTGRPIFYRAHEVWSEQAPQYPLASLWRILDRWLSPRVDEIFTPDANRAKIYRDEYGARALPTVVYNCPEIFDRPESSQLRSLLTQRQITAQFIVYYQGGLGPARSVTELVESMARLPDEVALALVGRPAADFISWLQDFLLRHNLQRRVAYLGFVHHGPELFRLAAGADVGMVFAKKDCRNNRFNLTATNKLFEYMMVGLPVIGSDTEGYCDFLEGQGIGLSVNSEDPASIAEGILRLLHDPKKRREMARKARLLAEEAYNWDRESVKLLSVYERYTKHDIS